MNTLINKVNAVINHSSVELNDKQKLFELVISEHLAYQLSLPADPVEKTDNPFNAAKSFFNVNYKPKLMDDIGTLNEIRVIDIDRVCELIYQFWKIRYDLVHGSEYFGTGKLIQYSIQGKVSLIDPQFKIIADKYLTVLRYSGESFRRQ